jgi:hypothetical protein
MTIPKMKDHPWEKEKEKEETESLSNQNTLINQHIYEFIAVKV